MFLDVDYDLGPFSDAEKAVLALADDGAGLDLARIREKAIKQGLMSEDEQPNDSELAEFAEQKIAQGHGEQQR